METRTTKRRKSGTRKTRKNKTEPAKAGFFNHKYSATERQSISKIVKEETPVPRNHWVGDPWADFDFEDYDDSFDYVSILRKTVGGKFLAILEKLSIIEADYYDYYLYAKLAKTPAGIVYADVYEKTKFDKILKKDGKVLGD